MGRELFDIQQENYVADRRSTRPMDRIQEAIEAEQSLAFLEGAQNVARTVKDGPLKLLLANVDKTTAWGTMSSVRSLEESAS